MPKSGLFSSENHKNCLALLTPESHISSAYYKFLLTYFNINRLFHVW